MGDEVTPRKRLKAINVRRRFRPAAIRGRLIFAAASVVFALAAWSAPALVETAAFAGFLMAAAVIDWRERRIPNKLVLSGLAAASALKALWMFKALAMASSPGYPGIGMRVGSGFAGALADSFAGALAGGLLLGGLHLPPYLLTGLGAGDVKFAFLLGFWLKPAGSQRYLGVYAFTLAVTAVFLAAAGRRRPASLPLAPFMAFAGFLCLPMYTR